MEKIQLGKFLSRKKRLAEDVEVLTAAERVRRCFEELGPTFVKLGQLLASRPDLVPEEYVLEFSKLHDRVQSLDFSIVQKLLQDELGLENFKKLVWIDPEPIGSASIAQVHQARLITGEEVVLKVQRPGITKTIEEDLGVLYMIAELIAKYLPETRPYDPESIVNEFFKTLELETNFIVEANNMRRFQENFKTDLELKIPKVFWELTTERILVQEALKGIPLSQDASLRQPDVDPHVVIGKALKIYLKMVFVDGLFHGDLHAGNFFIFPSNKLGLVDFGVVGRLNHKTKRSIASMLLALSKEDYERLAYEYVDLALFTEKINTDRFARDLRDLIAPYFGLNLKNVNLGKLLLSSASIAARHHLVVPSELMMFFKSIISIEGLGYKIDPAFDFLKSSLEFAGELASTNMEPANLMQGWAQVARESKNLIYSFPREVSFLLRKLNSPDHAFRFELKEKKEIFKVWENSFQLVFLGIIIGFCILSASILSLRSSMGNLSELPSLSYLIFGFGAALMIWALRKWK